MAFLTYSFTDLPLIPNTAVYASGQVTIQYAGDGSWADTTDGYFDGTDANLTLQPMSADDLRRVRDALQLHDTDIIHEKIADALADERDERRFGSLQAAE